MLKKSLPIVLALQLFLGIVLAILWNNPPNLDSSWLLYATAEWLGGKRLYVDILELNPPLIFLLNVPAVTAGWIFGITSTNGFYLCILGTMFCALIWVIGLCRTSAASVNAPIVAAALPSGPCLRRRAS